MRALHVPYTFHPSPMGGTEQYVAALAQRLADYGHESVIAAPGDASTTYEWNGLTVDRFAVSPKLTLEELYGDGDAMAARAFEQILDTRRPDVIHLHAFSPAVSVRLVGAAQARRIPVVFTYHTPAVSCQRGSLLIGGQEPCDGKLDVRRCTSCALHGMGLPRPMSAMLARVPRSIQSALRRSGMQGGIVTATRMTSLVERRQAAFSGLMNAVDEVVVPCRWALDLLTINGVAAQKLTLSRQGIAASDSFTPVRTCTVARDDVIRLVFLGRLDYLKGVDLVVDALLMRPDLRLELDIVGITQGERNAKYAAALRTRAARDPRIRFLEPVANADVPSMLSNYDALVVPSRALETGPLVVLEAFAGGLPVVGSRLGGVAELVRDGVDGLLVPATSVTAWQETFARLSPHVLKELRRNIQTPRSMAAVAADMDQLYARLGAARGIAAA